LRRKAAVHRLQRQQTRRNYHLDLTDAAAAADCASFAVDAAQFTAHAAGAVDLGTFFF